MWVVCSWFLSYTRFHLFLTPSTPWPKPTECTALLSFNFPLWLASSSPPTRVHISLHPLTTYTRNFTVSLHFVTMQTSSVSQWLTISTSSLFYPLQLKVLLTAPLNCSGWGHYDLPPSLWLAGLSLKYSLPLPWHCPSFALTTPKWHVWVVIEIKPEPTEYSF